MNSNLIILIFFLLGFINVNGQNYSTKELPYREIPVYEKEYSSGNIIARIIDGLGFRFYWATESLTEKDLEYRPTAEARSSSETLEHIYELSLMVLNAAKNIPNIRPLELPEFSYEELRSQTLNNLQQASNLLKNKNAEEIEKLKVVFQSDKSRKELPLWNLINGPVSDAIYHTGQLVSFRRTSGNPMNPKVNLLQGTLNE